MVEETKSRAEEGFVSDYSGESDVGAIFGRFGQSAFWCIKSKENQRSSLPEKSGKTLETRLLEVEVFYGQMCLITEVNQTWRSYYLES